MINTIRQRPYYKPFIWSLLGMILVMTIYESNQVLRSRIQADDFVEYWAAGRLNVNGGNPYDPEQLLPLQIAVGRTQGVPVMMWNPPWLLTFFMPLSLLNFQISRSIWYFVQFGILLWCGDTLWKLFNGENKTRWISWLIVFTFIPTIYDIVFGQTGTLLLLGTAGFLAFIRKHDYLAGLCLSLITIKPHVLLIFSLVVFIWIIKQRRWSVLFGAISGVLAASIITWLINPQVFSQYITALLTYPPANWQVSTLGGFLRQQLGFEMIWIQFLPIIFGILWMIYYWSQNHQNWNWLEQAPLLILVSLVCMPYGWPSDQTASLVALIQLGMIILIAPYSYFRYFLASVYIVLDIYLWTFQGNVYSIWWLALTLMLYYLAAQFIYPKTLSKRRFDSY